MTDVSPTPSGFPESHVSIGKLGRLGLLCSATLSAIIFLSGAGKAEALSWTKNTTGSYNWADANNWEGSTSPGNPEEASIIFSNAGAALAISLNTGGDQFLEGGITFNTSSVAPGGVSLNLQGNRLVFDGGQLRMASTANNSSGVRTAASFTNGTVQLGTDLNAATLSLDSGTPTGLIMQFDGAVFNTVNTTNILVAAEATNIGRNLTLDLAGATLKSGELNDALVVTGTISVGEHLFHQPTGGRNTEGTLKLGTVSTIEIGDDLVIGRNRRTGTSSAAVAAAGTLEVALNANPIALTIGRNLEIGVGDRGTGTISGDLSQEWNLTVGSEGRRGGIYIGAKLSPSGTSVVGDTLGSFASGGGTFSAFLEVMDIGRNSLAAGTAVGTFDMGAATLGVLDVSGAVTIGSGVGAQGALKLKGGEAKAQSVSVGTATGTPGRSLLSLNETAFEAESLTLGAFGDILVTIGDVFAGFDLTSSDAVDFSIAAGGVLNIVFTEDISSGVWGLRMLGDQSDLFESYLGDGRLVASGLYGDQAEIIFDGTYTYFGAAIPEPSAVLLLLGGGAAFLAVRRRNRAV